MVIFRQVITTGVEPEELSRKERERERGNAIILYAGFVCVQKQK